MGLSLNLFTNQAALFFILSLLVANANGNAGYGAQGYKRCLAQIPKKGICITVNDVNDALAVAMSYNKMSYTYQDAVDHYGNVAEVLHDTTLALAKKLYIPHPLAAAVFPTIDTLQTNIRQICPKPFTPGGLYCQYTKYRRVDGYCMNPWHPTWGAAGQAMKRFLLPEFGDGLAAPKTWWKGAKLPLPRVVSNVVHAGNYLRHEKYINVMFLHWAQFIDHDITDTPSPSYPGSSSKDYECCYTREHKDCWPLEIPPNDYFYGKWKKTCLNFIRSRPGILYGCPLGHRTVLNGNTPVIDGSVIYGRYEGQQYYLREFKLGRMKEYNPWGAKGYGLKGLMPQNYESARRCLRETNYDLCFHAGDYRAATQPGLTSLHTIMIRMHNYIADNLYKVNYHWGDERLYQETRRIVGAILQHVTYNEFLPSMLNKYEMDSWNLWVSATPYSQYEWDPTWDPQTSVYFSSAAFRLCHSLFPWRMDLYSVSHKPSGWWQLREVLQKTKYMYQGGMIDQVMHGAVHQPAEALDSAVNDELRNWLFMSPGAYYGQDLAARNIARGREHAIPGWAAFWNFCKLKPAIYSWKDAYYVMPNETVYKLQQVYRNVEDVDLWTGGISENKPYGGIVGPTFGCLISEQFSNIKQGDRFWYENAYLPSSFTIAQVSAIKKITLARILCNFLDYAKSMPKWAMLLPDYGKNPLLPCNSIKIANFDFEPWREPAAPFYRGYKN